MAWAVYDGGASGHLNNAVRFHLSFDINANCPAQFQVTAGRECEREAWDKHQHAESDALHIGDRYYGGSFGKLDECIRKKHSFLVRLRENGIMSEEQDLPLSEADRAEGIVRQAWVELGVERRGKWRRQREKVRIIWIQREDKMIVLCTNLEASALPAGLAAQMYRDRWLVEFFFRWIKCLLGCRHWLVESHNGVLYMVIIIALLLQLSCGQCPGWRTMEMLQFYFQGLASEAELAAHLELEAQRRADKQAAKKI